MNLSALQRTLAELGVRPQRRLGQNFLHDRNLARWIVAQLDLQRGEHLVEIGPGLGALTSFALDHGVSATLIEKDRRLAAALQTTFGGRPGVEVVAGDALEFDPRELFVMGGAKLLGNLPYCVTSEILFRFTAAPCPFQRIVLTTQREFADRLAARPRTKDYGALTLLVQRGWRVKFLRRLPPSVFMPAPKVESAVIQLVPRSPEELPECDTALFAALVRAGFSQRRKQLRKLLAAHVSDWPAAAAHIGVALSARAEELDLGQWIALAALLRPSTSGQPQDVHGERFPLVDAEDRVIGEVSRDEAHRRGLRHRAVHVFVFNSAGELFLQKRSRWKDAHPGLWDSSAAGHVASGDTYEATAPRELREELGIEAPLEPVAHLPASAATGHEFVRLYAARHDGPFHLPLAEIETGGFFPVGLIRRWQARRPQDFASGFLACFHAWEKARSVRGGD